MRPKGGSTWPLLTMLLWPPPTGLPRWWGMSPMTLWVALPLLAGIGLIYAGLWAVYVHTLNGKRPLVAAIVDAIVTSFSFAAWAIMVRTGRENDALGIVCYSIGGAIGTYIVLKMKMHQAQIQAQQALDEKGKAQAS